MNWFTVDKDGLRKLMDARGKSAAILELVQNAFDAEGSARVEISLAPVPNRAFAMLVVTDDAPTGFANLAHAWTLFAESNRKADPEKRGRFNLGEKLILSLCREATITTTTGAVRFDAEGRHRLREKTKRGSRFAAEIAMTRDELRAACDLLRLIIPPTQIAVTLNDVPIHRDHADLIAAPSATLPTEISDGSGILRRSLRKTLVAIWRTREGEEAHIFEMGIPVVATGDRFHVNVCVAPETKILGCDLRYLDASDVKEGMNLVGFDEERSATRRRFRSTSVTNVERITRPCYRLTFDDGTVVVCSEDHQWLCLNHGTNSGHGRTTRWRSTKRMVVAGGKRAASCVAKPLSVWRDGESFSDGYVAGTFDGEGCFFQKRAACPTGVVNALSFSQVDNSMLADARSHLDALGFSWRDALVKRANPNHKDIHTTSISMRADIIRLLGQCRPRRLLEKLNIDMLGTMPTRFGVRLIKKEFIGDQSVIAIETESHTFIAEGLASHNCQKIPLNMNRDNVTPSYLQQLRAIVLSAAFSELHDDDSRAPWVRNAMEDPDVSPDAVRAVVKLQFGDRAVINDISDPEGTKIAVTEGYAVVPGGAYSAAAWRNVRAADALLPAGRVTPSPKPFSPGGRPLKMVEVETSVMLRARCHAKLVAERIIGKEITVRFANDRNWPFVACYGDSELTLNVPRVPTLCADTLDEDSLNELLLHELAHDRVMDHLGNSFHEECCRLGMLLAKMYREQEKP